MLEGNPVHVAIIMDGNRRWAKKNHLPTFFGYRRGIHTVSESIQAALKNNINYLTLFAFSTENWKRPQYEVTYLMGLFLRSIEHYSTLLMKENICVHCIGDLNKLDEILFKKITSLQEKTKHNRRLFLTIAINYGSYDELVRAISKIPTSKLNNYSWEMIRQYLDTRNLPDVDIFIRTSGEQRLSNFLLLQSAYAELFFVKKFWPEFTQQDFETILEEYQLRGRSFGR
ncbi:MAG: di-trans,poly-cis-decaprenylcistransferase [Puniceicoccales bacterium]|jgi:undecaprenyl diphosphate synthase|nr:di-trans,poly-cis-decaprenylcistransferase [Puniceicoccales bacterium]